MITEDEVPRSKDTLIEQMGEILGDLNYFDAQIVKCAGFSCP